MRPLTLLTPLTPLAVLAVLALGGCGYTSSYVAPPDGRARMGWVDGQLTAIMPRPDMQLCYGEAPPEGAPPAELPPEEAPRRRHGGGVVLVWVPYVPPPVVVVSGPKIIGPSRFLAGPSVGSTTKIRDTNNLPKEAAVLLAVALFVAMPVISIALAVDPPGTDDAVASAMDEVNETNDRLRQAAVPCAAEPKAEPSEEPQEEAPQ